MEIITENLIKIFLDYIWIANLIFIIIIILIEKKNPLYTIFWVFLLSVFPYLGFFLYLFLGISFRKQRVANKIYNLKIFRNKRNLLLEERQDLKRWQSLFNYLEMTSKNSPSINNLTEIYNLGENFFDELKKEITSAKKTIYMEYFIFKFDNIGREICELLVERARAGIKIIIIVDGLNSANRKLSRYFKNTGIDINFFFKTYIPLFNLRVNYRNHRKITVIDSRVAFIGGMNIGDEYRGNFKDEFWRDTSVKVMGEVVIDIEKEFFFTLSIVKGTLIKYEKYLYEYNDLVKKELKKHQKKYFGCVQLVSSGPNYEFRTLRDSFLKLIQGAEKSILIQTPYFVPDDSLLDALKAAIISGVDVKIMIPSKGDHLFVYWVNQFYIGELLNLGASIYRYEKGFIHSKVLIIDNDVVSIGTCNFDYRSFYLNFEINLNIYENESAILFKNQFYKDIADSKKITIADFSRRNIFSKIKESIFRLLSPIL